MERETALCLAFQGGLSYAPAMSDVTQLLQAIDAGEPKAAEELLPLVYEELRKLAAAKMAQEQLGQTLLPTALVHEAWLRLVGEPNPQFATARPKVSFTLTKRRPLSHERSPKAACECRMDATSVLWRCWTLAPARPYLAASAGGMRAVTG